MTEELIKFTPGERPAHIGPDEMCENRRVGDDKWMPPFRARWSLWSDGWEYRFADPLKRVADDQLEAQCKARGWTVTKPLVTQAERDRLADAMDAFGPVTSRGIKDGIFDDLTRAFIDTYEGAKP